MRCAYWLRLVTGVGRTTLPTTIRTTGKRLSLFTQSPAAFNLLRITLICSRLLFNNYKKDLLLYGPLAHAVLITTDFSVANSEMFAVKYLSINYN